MPMESHNVLMMWGGGHTPDLLEKIRFYSKYVRPLVNKYYDKKIHEGGDIPPRVMEFFEGVQERKSKTVAS